jgi:hypothetical protein
MKHGWIGTGVVETRFGDFDFVGGFPTPKTARRLYEMRTFNRALEVYAEQMPGVSMFQIRKGLASFGARASHQIVVWKTLMDARTELLTGNSETVYAMGFLDLRRDGPTVIDAPPGILGGLSEMWQAELIGIGPTGADKGKGGRFLILPPDYQGTPPSGYILATSQTYGVLVGLRGFLVEGQPDAAAATMRMLKIYPLSRAANPPTMHVIDGSRHDIATVFEDNYHFFEDLAALVDQEPADAIPSHERFHLASIGIEKGRPFTPDVGRRQLLADAACLASAVARTNTFASNDPDRFPYPDRCWEWVFLGGGEAWDAQGFINSDRRAAFAYAAIGMSPAMVRKVVGQGSQYLWTMRDAEGRYLDGSRTYRLRLPRDIPVASFWSVVVYDPMSRSMLKNGQPFPSVSGYTNPVVSDGGSIDIYFGPRAPDGGATNWITTLEDRGWFTLLRFYGPTKSFFDKSWKPGDVELID